MPHDLIAAYAAPTRNNCSLAAARPLRWSEGLRCCCPHPFDPVDPVLQESGFGVTFPNYIVDVQKDPETGAYKEAIQFQCLERGGGFETPPVAPTLRGTHALLAPRAHECASGRPQGSVAFGAFNIQARRRAHLRGHQLPLARPDDERCAGLGYATGC